MLQKVIACGFIVLLAMSIGCKDQKNKAGKSVDVAKTKTDKKADKKSDRVTIELPLKIEQPKDKLGPGNEEQLKLLTQAKKFYLSNQLDKAEPYFKALSEKTPLSGPVVSGTIALGDIYAASGREEEANQVVQGVACQGFIDCRGFPCCGSSLWSSG